jgi:predicted cupin superfamily sugar epimerase
MITVDELRTGLGLEPLPLEGGYFAESYRTPVTLPEEVLPEGYSGSRSLATAIYYLLTPDTFSAMHRLRSDEMYHFYLGDPVEQLRLFPDGRAETVRLGTPLLEGMQLQTLVPGGVWQGSRLVRGGKFALMGTTMAPGFDPADYEQGNRDRLTAAYPESRDLIEALTR